MTKADAGWTVKTYCGQIVVFSAVSAGPWALVKRGFKLGKGAEYCTACRLPTEGKP